MFVHAMGFLSKALTLITFTWWVFDRKQAILNMTIISAIAFLIFALIAVSFKQQQYGKD